MGYFNEVKDLVKLCPECGEENDNSAKFCQECGSPLTKELKTTLNENRENRRPIYALVTIIGVIFIIIDGLGLILNLLLVPLGLILTMGGLVRLFPKTFKPKAIMIGFAAFMVVYYLLFILSFMYIGDLSSAGYFTIFIIAILVSGAMAGYISGKSYLNGCIMGLLMGMIFSIGFTKDIYTFIGGFAVLTIFGLIGGLIGAFIFRMSHSSKVLE